MQIGALWHRSSFNLVRNRLISFVFLLVLLASSSCPCFCLYFSCFIQFLTRSRSLRSNQASRPTSAARHALLALRGRFVPLCVPERESRNCRDRASELPRQVRFASSPQALR